MLDGAIGGLAVVPFECEVSSAEEVVDHHPKDGNAQRVAECEGNTEPAEKLKQVVRAADKVEQAAVGDMRRMLQKYSGGRAACTLYEESPLARSWASRRW